MMKEKKDNVKNSKDTDYKIEIAGNAGDFNPDEEKFPENANEITGVDQEDLEKDKDLNQRRIGQKETQHGGKINQEKTVEKTYIENVKRTTERDYIQSNETYGLKIDNDKTIEDSKLNPVTETQFQAPDPDEPNSKSDTVSKNGVRKKMRNKNQPL